MRLLIFVLVLLSVLSCRKEPIICDAPHCGQDSIPSADTMKLLWSIPYNTAGSKENNVDLYFQSNEKLIMVCEGNESVRQFSILDSTFTWTYSKFPHHRYSSYSIDLENNLFGGCYFSYTASVDLKSGEEYWQNDVHPYPRGNPRMGLIGNYFYHAHAEKEGDNRFNAIVKKSLFENQDWDTLFILDALDFDNFSPGFITPNLWMHPITNDSILIIPVRMVEFDKNLRRSDLIAFNLRTREILWQVEDFTPIVLVDKPIIYDGIVIVRSTTKVFAYNLQDGSLMWTHTETQEFANYLNSDMKVVDGKLIVGENTGSVLTAFNPNTGEVLWRHTGAFAGSNNNIVHYKDYIIIANFDKLDVFDVRDGKHVYKVRNTVRRFRGRMALDEANRKLYVPENSQIVAYELPEEF